MDVKELMIGDLVRVNKDVCIKKDTIVRVCEIDGDRRFQELTGCIICVAVDDIDEMTAGVWLAYIEPIPLTDKILKQNGFEYFHKNYASLSREHPFQLKMNVWPDENGLGGLWTICDIIEIRYVHELQHALRLCGIEKEFILNK